MPWVLLLSLTIVCHEMQLREGKNTKSEKKNALQLKPIYSLIDSILFGG